MEKLVVKLNEGLVYIAKGITMLMVLLITFDVLGRWIFNQPITGSVELVGFGLSMVIFLSIGYTHLYEEHISIEFLVDKLPEKVRYLIDGVINVVITVLMILIAGSLMWYVSRLYGSGTITGDLGIPIYIMALITVAGSLVFALTSLHLAIKYFGKVGQA
ncbi:TRAP transporter small permease [Salinicoccus roseus]|uniref:TRAP transporter small permease n=1 Tax=Salinicoccus roseus TaxID=45670 RepID=UPI002300F4E8|nr:TRAP transporter small permease [Salinicoccus roseus]